MKKIISILIISLFGLSISSCQNKVQKKKTKTMKKFEWLPTECAPEIYPIEIYKGILSSEDGSIVRIPSGGRTVKNGWGKIGSTYLVGEDFKSVPNQLDISWLSYTENKFYKGRFELPSEKMNSLFEKGYINRLGKQETYSEIIVGMAPGGIVSVWMLGSGFSVEIEHYQAKEVNISMEDFNPDGIQDQDLYIKGNLDELSEERKEQLKKVGIKYDIWKKYRKRYSWKPRYIFSNESKSNDILIDFYNGEHLFVLTNNEIFDDYYEFAIPKYIRFYWEDKNKNKFGSKIYFNEAEIFTIFNTIFNENETEHAELIIKIDKYNSNFNIYLKSQQNSIEIKKTKIKIFQTD